MDYIILYSYFENDLSLKNLEFFIKNAIFDNKNVKYVFIINGHKLSINLPARSQKNDLHIQ